MYLGRNEFPSTLDFVVFMLNTSTNYYETLGVTRSADNLALHQAFRELSKRLHPDTTSLPYEEAIISFQKACEAYELLADPVKRKAYDFILDEQTIKEKLLTKSFQSIDFATPLKQSFIGERRPFSGGELLAILLLGIALVFSLSLGIVFAMTHGRELMIVPSWLLNISVFQPDFKGII